VGLRQARLEGRKLQHGNMQMVRRKRRSYLGGQPRRDCWRRWSDSRRWIRKVLSSCEKAKSSFISFDYILINGIFIALNLQV